MIRPMVKIPHTIASPSIKGVQVHVIGTSTDCKPVGKLPQDSRCRPQPAILNLEEWPNADIIALLATPVAGISTSVAGIKRLRELAPGRVPYLPMLTPFASAIILMTLEPRRHEWPPRPS